MPLQAHTPHARVESASPLKSAEPDGGAMLQSGDLAPLFSLPDADMETFDLASLRGKQHLVLYFYPRDNTPGCTLQAADFSDREGDFAAYDCTVIGISPPARYRQQAKLRHIYFLGVAYRLEIET